MDRRQRKTRKAIFDAFAKLLDTKSYSNITVQEIYQQILFLDNTVLMIVLSKSPEFLHGFLYELSGGEESYLTLHRRLVFFPS